MGVVSSPCLELNVVVKTGPGVFTIDINFAVMKNLLDIKSLFYILYKGERYWPSIVPLFKNSRHLNENDIEPI